MCMPTAPIVLVSSVRLWESEWSPGKYPLLVGQWFFA